MQSGNPMKRHLKEFHDSWDGMLPVNINKGNNSIPKLDTSTLYSEEEQFRVYDITSPKSIGVLGNILMNTLAEYENPAAPFEALLHVKLALNRFGYDVNFVSSSIIALGGMGSGFADFPLFHNTSALYPYQFDQKYPGTRIEDDGIERELGYKLVVRIHTSLSTFDYNGQEIPYKKLEGEIVPQDA